ncbi:hypothetical protein [Mycobacterium sp.]|uniref:hypothetical protein n=1 Tax=Mycobacterium sp. TaxID=1785 RepID=UPI003C75CB09
MELKKSSRVGLVDENAWAGPTNLERIALCMLDATYEQIVGTEFRTNVKVQVGPFIAHERGRPPRVRAVTSQEVSV